MACQAIRAFLLQKKSFLKRCAPPRRFEQFRKHCDGCAAGQVGSFDVRPVQTLLTLYEVCCLRRIPVILRSSEAAVAVLVFLA